MIRSIALLCILSLTLAGCGRSTVGTPLPPVHYRTSLEWGIVGIDDVPTLDPALASDPTSISVASLIFGGLVRFDSRMRVVPDAARSWKITHGGTVYTFALRHTVRFSDGRPVHAADFVQALQRALGPESSTGTAPFYLGSIARGSTPSAIVARDPWTLRITLTRPSAHFLSELAFPASFVPDPAVVERYGPNWTDHAAGFGPFRVRSWSHTRYLSLERNPYYWEGKPHLARITLHIYAENHALAAYKAGRLDVVSGLLPGQTIPGRPRGLRRVPGLALDYLAFNTGRLPFFRINARRAFAAVWQPSFVQQALGTAAFPATGFLPAAFGISVSRWHPAKNGPAYLARARYPHARGFPAITLIMQRDPRIYALASEMTLAWQVELGVHVGIRQLNPSNYSKVLAARTFDLALVRWGADYPDLQDFLGTQLGPSTDNITGWSTGPYTRTVNLADSYDPADPRRTGLFHHAAELAARKLPLLPLDQPALTALIAPGLQNVSLTPLGTIWGNWKDARLVVRR